MLEIGAVVCGFLIKSVTPLPDMGGQMWRMTYEKNGAELVWLERKDEVKSFAISFRTLPEDDTGVAHILEHSVLMGSDKYPVKSPFEELKKSSLRVFMNAMTAQDFTSYPVATRNDQDLLNLTDVYLDAVFNPTAVKSPIALQQEGWHFEMDPSSGELSYNGVVYNEMKGVFAQIEQRAGREALHRLYAGTPYGHDSGGNPSEIPQLTFEKFCAFYHRYYHPSNSMIFLDGSVDIVPMLSKLDTYLSRYERVSPAVAMSCRGPVECRETIMYASSDCTRKTVLADAWNAWRMGPADPVGMVVLDALIEYLAGSNEAPLKRALLSRGLCEDVYLYNLDYREQPVVMIVRNTSDEQAAECRAVVRQTIGELVAAGLDRERLRAIIARHEFDEREVDTSIPRGLAFGTRVVRQWLRNDDPAAAFDLTGIFAKVRRGLDEGLFERTLRDTFLDNQFHVELTFSPSAQVATEEAACTAAELKRRRAEMTPEDVESLRRELKALEEYQAREDSKADREKIPSLHVADLPKTHSIVEHSISETNGITMIRTKSTCDGVVYVSAYFPIDGLDEADLATMPLFAELLGDLATERHSALDLQTAIKDKVGRITFNALAAERGNYLSVKLAVLAGREDEALALLREILFETKFDDAAAIGTILRQRQIAVERMAGARGSNLAISYAARGLSRRFASRDLLGGYSQLRWLQSAAADGRLAARYRDFARRIFVKQGLILSVTDNISESAVKTFVEMLGTSDGTLAVKSRLQLGEGRLDGIRLDGDIGFAGAVAMLPEGCDFSGSMLVASTIVSSDYLHREVREKGGAYGTMLNVDPCRLIMGWTYRDPDPVASVKKMGGCGAALREFLETDARLERYIVATIADLDPYQSPVNEALRPVSLYLARRSPEDENAVRRQVLSTTKDDLRRVADVFTRQLASPGWLVVGGERQVGSLDPSKVEPLRPATCPGNAP